jgi:FkbM family methyltransferase
VTSKAKHILRRLIRPKVIREHGVLLDVSSQTISSALRRVLYDGRYEAQEISILKKTLNQQDILLDVGAGIGLTPIWAAQYIQRPASVWAVEAYPEVADIINTNIELNGVDIALLWSAVMAEQGITSFYTTEHFWSSSVLPRGSKNSINVPCVTLEGLIEEIKPTYIMMDVEGAEYQLLITSQLKDVKKLCVEIHPHYIGESKALDLINHLYDIGFNANKTLCANNGYFFIEPSHCHRSS